LAKFANPAMLNKRRSGMPTRNVNLTPHYDDFIADGIKAGRYSNASEAVRAGLRLLEQQEQEDRAKIEWLRGTAQEAFAALDQGEGLSLSSAEDIDALVNGVLAEHHASRLTSNV
jgi:antitoxin ParD1/3/4